MKMSILDMQDIGDKGNQQRKNTKKALFTGNGNEVNVFNQIVKFMECELEIMKLACIGLTQ